MKKIALLGGSFNPVHLRHVSLAQDLLDSGKIDEVWFLVSYHHRFKKNSIPFEERCKMVKIAIQGRKGMKLSIEEKNLSGVSYTADVVKHLQKKYSYKFYWIVGTDLLKGMRNWYKREELFSLIEFVVVKRSGFDFVKVSKMKVYYFHEKNINGFSSTTVRNKIIKGEKLKSFIDEGVIDYIKEKKLYQDGI